MIVLLDTHTLIWWFNEPASLSRRVSTILSSPENTVLVSAAVAWEIAIKSKLGKLDAIELTTNLRRQIVREGFNDLPISIEHATKAGLLPMHHRDPFDRLLIAQAQDMDIPILSIDSAFDHYRIKRLW